MKRAKPQVGKLLRWYPRAWRERYGEEFLALVQDTLDGQRLTWRLRLGVALAGLRERCYHAAGTAKAGARRTLAGWLTAVMLGSAIALVLANLKAPLHATRTGQGTAALDALLAVAAFTCAAVLAGALIAWPALVRFLQAGGWPKIRGRIARAAGAAVLAGGGLAGLLLVPRSMSSAQLSRSLGYWVGFMAASVTLMVALGLWISAVTGLRKDLKLAPRARAAEVVLGAVIPVGAWVSVGAFEIWYHTVQLSIPWLLFWTCILASYGVTGSISVRRAVRRSRRILAASGPGR